MPEASSVAAPAGLAGSRPRPRLSVVVITRNEAQRIERCLRSVDFADEWLVVDSGSTDDTVNIARKLGATVQVHADWPGFGPQKNRALAMASGEWVLSLDADECVTPQLAAAIRAAIGDSSGSASAASPAASPAASQVASSGAAPGGYWIRRNSSFCGRLIRFGDWSGDRVLRLFRRDAGRFSDDIVHERIDVRGPQGQLDGVLLHDSVESIADGRDKMLRYARLGAIKLRARRPRGLALGGWPDALLRGGWTFIRGYLLRLGFLDGLAGLRIAMLNARGTFLRYRWAADRSRSLELDDRQ